MFVAIVVAVAAFVAGPARPAAAFRGWWGRAVTWAGTDAGQAGWGVLSSSNWIGRNKRLLRILLAVAIFVIAFRWPQPTSAVLIWLALLGLVGLALIDFYGRTPTTEPAPAP
jgi:hypothetical protein